MANILIVDDDNSICDMICQFVAKMGHESVYALTGEEGIRLATAETFDIIFLDVGLPDCNGLSLLSNFRKTPSLPEVIIITGYGDPDGAELAIKNKAWDYIEKPFSVGSLTLSINRALQYRGKKDTGNPPVVLKRDGLIGNSPEMQGCLNRLAHAANSPVNVLITGETGTGKELFARIIHENSGRVAGNFVVVDCAGLPGTLVESMLFGHEKGAFTGADKSREGLVKQADGGTLFLDEVGELPLSVQGIFLRVLQERRFRPIGGRQEIQSNFRLLAATNRNLDQMVETGAFRKDLLFRIKSVVLELPPLRVRKKDICSIAAHYLTKFCRNYNTVIKGMSPEFIEALTAYQWPGNVRELVNTMENVLSQTGDEPVLFPVHLPTRIRIELARRSVNRQPTGSGLTGTKVAAPGIFPELRSLLETTEEHYLKDLIAYTKGDIKKACRISGLSKSRLYVRLKKYALSRRF
jgi:DNA-binding NtrC family response regulator